MSVAAILAQSVDVPEERKKFLRDMASGCDIEALKREIEQHLRNQENFARAIHAEDVVIAEYHYILALRETEK